MYHTKIHQYSRVSGGLIPTALQSLQANFSVSILHVLVIPKCPEVTSHLATWRLPEYAFVLLDQLVMILTFCFPLISFGKITLL